MHCTSAWSRRGDCWLLRGDRGFDRELTLDVKLGALTNAAVAYAETVLNPNGLRGRFAVVHGVDDVAKPKSAPDAIIQCLEEMRVDAREAVYIGGSPPDGRAALSAGC